MPGKKLSFIILSGWLSPIQLTFICLDSLHLLTKIWWWLTLRQSQWWKFFLRLLITCGPIDVILGSKAVTKHNWNIWRWFWELKGLRCPLGSCRMSMRIDLDVLELQLEVLELLLIYIFPPNIWKINDLLQFCEAVVIIKVFLHLEQLPNLAGTSLEIRYDIIDVLKVLGVDFGTEVDQLEYNSEWWYFFIFYYSR